MKNISESAPFVSSSNPSFRQYAMLKIQRALREKRPADAAGLYRKCRDIWYSEDIFGSKDILPEEEFVELRNIFYTDLSEIAESLVKAEQEAENRFGSSEMLDENGGSEEEDEESDYETKEVQFDFDGYVVRFAASDVIKWSVTLSVFHRITLSRYLFLLDDFDKNSSELNKALVKMLHRIGFDLKMHCRLFQVTFFPLCSNSNISSYPCSEFCSVSLRKSLLSVPKNGRRVSTTSYTTSEITC